MNLASADRNSLFPIVLVLEPLCNLMPGVIIKMYFVLYVGVLILLFYYCLGEVDRGRLVSELVYSYCVLGNAVPMM